MIYPASLIPGYTSQAFPGLFKRGLLTRPRRLQRRRKKPTEAHKCKEKKLCLLLSANTDPKACPSTSDVHGPPAACHERFGDLLCITGALTSPLPPLQQPPCHRLQEKPPRGLGLSHLAVRRVKPDRRRRRGLGVSGRVAGGGEGEGGRGGMGSLAVSLFRTSGLLLERTSFGGRDRRGLVGPGGACQLWVRIGG